MCKCANVAMGSYGNQVIMNRPAHMIGRKEGSSNPETICIDTCLVDEIIDLWHKGIITTGCCCGHNTHHSYIGVIDGHVSRMLSLGYEVLFNPNRPMDRDTFKAKSIKQQEI